MNSCTKYNWDSVAGATEKSEPLHLITSSMCRIFCIGCVPSYYRRTRIDLMTPLVAAPCPLHVVPCAFIRHLWNAPESIFLKKKRERHFLYCIPLSLSLHRRLSLFDLYYGRQVPRDELRALWKTFGVLLGDFHESLKKLSIPSSTLRVVVVVVVIMAKWWTKTGEPELYNAHHQPATSHRVGATPFFASRCGKISDRLADFKNKRREKKDRHFLATRI